ncbi:MAG: glycine cleavage system protein GcvH [Nitrospira sp.]|nr:glycine cleavage system protein GcvH [Candidatus Brocadiales bacterium]MBL7049593.1 glycine cleavage system protein GcvH [Nitrospira sp.]
MNPDGLKFHKEHSWVKIDGNKATVGISYYAQESLGDIVYVDEPEIGMTIEAGAQLTEIESTKATSPAISPVSGTIIEFNDELSDSPEIINEDPLDKGWIAVIEMDNEIELEELMETSAYEKYLEDEVKAKE